MFFEEMQVDTNKYLMENYLKCGVYHAVIFVYDLTSTESFEKLEDLYELFQKNGKTSDLAHFAIVGTKLDQIRKEPTLRAVEKEDIKEWMRETKEEIYAAKTGQYCKYFEISTMEDRGVETLMFWIANVATKNYDRVEQVRYG